MTTKHILATACLAAIAIMSIPPLWAQDAAPPPPAGNATAAKPPVDKTLLDNFYAGGSLMWPLLLCSIGTTAVGIYCFLQINSKKMMPKAQVEAEKATSYGVVEVLRRYPKGILQAMGIRFAENIVYYIVVY
jgi:hypothetical protein